MVKKENNKTKDISEKFKDFPSVFERGERDEELVIAEARTHHPDYPIWHAMARHRSKTYSLASERVLESIYGKKDETD